LLSFLAKTGCSGVEVVALAEFICGLSLKPDKAMQLKENTLH